MAVRDYILSVKIAGWFAAIILAIVVGAGTLLWQLGWLDSSIETMIDARFASVRACDSLLFQVGKLQQENTAVSLAFASSDVARQDLIVTLTRNKTASDTLDKVLRATPVTAADSASAARLRAAHDPFRKGLDKIIKLVSEDNAVDAMAELTGDFSGLKQNLATQLIEYRDLQNSAIDGNRTQIADSLAGMRWRLIVVILIAIAAAAYAAFWIIRQVSTPLHQAAALASRVAAGDLSGDLKSKRKDEVGWLFLELAKMTAFLRRLADGVHRSSERVAGAAATIARDAASLVSGTEAQASTLEETAATAEELSAAVRNNSDNAQRAGALAADAEGVSLRGRQAVQQVVDTMATIHTGSKKIADIIGVIDAIAFQTNILALNAAVEAARAGDHGRGFAVVAAEVRNLAQRVVTAAKEIKELITESVGQVEAGNAHVAVADQAIAETVAGIQSVAQHIRDIAAASGNQTQGIEQVNQAIVQMERSTQHNAALAQTTTDAVQLLQDEANQLVELVHQFGQGRNSGPPMMAPRESMSATALPPQHAASRRLTRQPDRPRRNP